MHLLNATRYLSNLIMNRDFGSKILKPASYVLTFKKVVLRNCTIETVSLL